MIIKKCLWKYSVGQFKNSLVRSIILMSKPTLFLKSLMSEEERGGIAVLF